jgi:predicted DNA-binding transcriptional regulator AlpA
VAHQLDNLIGTTDVAGLLGWSRAKVKREAKAGRLPYEHKVGGQTGAYLFHRSVIETIAANRARAEAAAHG